MEEKEEEEKEGSKGVDECLVYRARLPTHRALSLSLSLSRKIYHLKGPSSFASLAFNPYTWIFAMTCVGWTDRHARFMKYRNVEVIEAVYQLRG